MAGDDDLLSIFSALPDSGATSGNAPAAPRKMARPQAPIPEDDKISLNELSDMFGVKISAAALDSFHGPTDEQVRRAKEERERLASAAAAETARPEPGRVVAAPPADSGLEVKRLEAKLRAELEREVQERVEQEMAQKSTAQAAQAKPSRDEILAQVRSQMSEWDDLRKIRDEQDRAAAAAAPPITAVAAPVPTPVQDVPVEMPPILPAPPVVAAASPPAPQAPFLPPPMGLPPLAAPSLPPPMTLPVPPPSLPAGMPAMPGLPSMAPRAAEPPASTTVGGLKFSHTPFGVDPNAAPPPPPKKQRQLTETSRLDLLIMFEEARKILFQVVSQLIGAKATLTMLAKTFEKSRTKHPKTYRNSNWKSDGSLREDGSLDKDRTLRNLQDIPVPNRSEELISALADLLALRLSAIEQGLARKVKAAVICDITEQLDKMAGGGRVEKTNVALFVEEILPPVTLD